MQRSSILLVGHGNVADCRSSSDGIAYQRILAYRTNLSSRGNQIRDHMGGGANLPAGDAIPFGATLTITHLGVHASIGYALDGTSSCSKKWLRDPIWWSLWRAEDGVTTPTVFYDEVIPANTLGLYASPNPAIGTITLGNLYVEGTNVSTFRRDLRPTIPQPIVITESGAGETFEVKMRLTQTKVAFEYDVWAGGYLDTP